MGFILCLLSLLLYLLLPLPVVTRCRIPFGGHTGLWHRCLPGTCWAARITVGQWRHLLGFGRSSQDKQRRFVLGENFRTCFVISSSSFFSLCSLAPWKDSDASWGSREAGSCAVSLSSRLGFPTEQLQALALQRLQGLCVLPWGASGQSDGVRGAWAEPMYMLVLNPQDASAQV